MIPVGYLRKRKTARPEWLDAPTVKSVVAVSDCVMKPVLDVFTLGGFNGWFFFDAPSCFDLTLRELGADFEETCLLYFEVYEEDFDELTHQWGVLPLPQDPVNVLQPTGAQLLGFDVASFYMRSSPECSGLSCSSHAAKLEPNEHGLFATLEDAKAALEKGFFDRAEPGPHRIFAVHRIDETSAILS